MDLSPAQSPAPLPVALPVARPAIALLVDAENLSKDLAPAVLAAASRLGPPQVRRAYGNLNAVTDWQDHGFRLCPTRPGKNAADMLLCVEAMALALQSGFETLVIASSDRDFSYLAEHLREMGKTVVGMGRDTAPQSFRASCNSFIQIGLPSPISTPIQKAMPKPVLKSLLDHVKPIVAGAGKTGLPIQSLGPVAQKLGIKISGTPEKTWRAWLIARESVFVCDPKGPNARVRLRA